MSPTARTLKKLADDGWLADICERWIRKQRFQKPTTKDLFGVGDILAVKGQETLLIQCTTGANGSSRCYKVKAEPKMHDWLSSYTRTMQVWAWRKLKSSGKWEPKISQIRKQDLKPVPGEGS